MKRIVSFSFVALLAAFLNIATVACSPTDFNAATTTATASGVCSTSGYVYNPTYGTCVPATATTTGACTTGYVYSSTYGCLPQSTCSSGYGLYNGSCVLLVSQTLTCATGYVYSSSTGACVAQAVTCSSGYYWNGSACVANVASGDACQATCPAGYVYTQQGCLPRTGLCPYCAGFDGYLCYWSVFTLQTGIY